MKRHEWWRKNYRTSRDLDHLSPEQLSERLFDCINNSRVRTERGKLGLLPHDEGGEQWFIWMTEIFEECVLRNYGYPGPINISCYGTALAHAFDPVPNMDVVIAKHNLASKPYLLKFGNPFWLQRSFKKGKFRIAPASFYDSFVHNHARRDAELKRMLTPNPRDPRLKDFMASRGIIALPGKEPSTITIEASTDYYLFSLCGSYSSRLFGDFAATGCLVIYDPKTFLKRLEEALRERLKGWAYQIGLINYYDPVRMDPKLIDVRFFKPFRHAYQKEMRLVWTPPTATERLELFEVEIGSLANYGELVDTNRRPPVILPPDPGDARIVTYGNLCEDDAMVNQLPDVAKIQGMLLSREADRHEEWYFKIQYTDIAGTWHEMKVPMLDGLYLLNMLRAAEKDQHLSIWNRE
jgi:hypothetical protein